MTGIVLEKTAPPPANPSKSGEYHDRCPEDGCLDVDRIFKGGGRDGRNQEHLRWSTYFADPRMGGCGMNWARTTRQGREADQKRGVNPKWPTRAGLVETYQSLPSQQYQDNYACAFQKCGCRFCTDYWEMGVPARCEPRHHNEEVVDNPNTYGEVAYQEHVEPDVLAYLYEYEGDDDAGD